MYLMTQPEKFVLRENCHILVWHCFLVSKQFSKADYMEEIAGNPLYRFGKRISWNASKPSSLKEIDRTLQKKCLHAI